MSPLRLTLATILTFSSSAFAFQFFDDATMNRAIPRPDSSEARGAIALPFNVDFEPPDWHSGSASQNGWTAISPNVPAIVAPSLRGGSQFLRYSDDPLIGPAFPGAMYFSPTFTGATGPVTLTTQIRISSTGGADYYVNPQSPSLNLTCARVRLAGRDPNSDGRPGDILLLNDANGPAPGGLQFENTGANYVPGSFKELRIAFVGNNQIQYYYDNALIFVGSTLFNDAGQTCNGHQIEELLLADNQQQLPGEFADYDDIAATPEPASLLLVGLATCVVRCHIRRHGRIRPA